MTLRARRGRVGRMAEEGDDDCAAALLALRREVALFLGDVIAVLRHGRRPDRSRAVILLRELVQALEED